MGGELQPPQPPLPEAEEAAAAAGGDGEGKVLSRRAQVICFLICLWWMGWDGMYVCVHSGRRRCRLSSSSLYCDLDF